MTKAQIRLNRTFDEIISKLPWTAKFINWLRTPKNAWIRIPASILLILGGIFSILPGLGLWMLPVGLLFLSIDIIFLQEPVTKGIVIAKRKIPQWWNYVRRMWKR